MPWFDRIRQHGSLLAVIVMALGFVLADPHPTKAVISSTPCSGNVCTGTVTVGGQAVQYSYTQHLSAAGQFRIRFNGGVYNTASTVSFLISGLPSFASTGYLANPTNGAATMASSDVNPTSTAYERYDADGCPSCIFDHVMSVQYTALAAGTYTFNITILQNGATGGVASLPFYVDATAPTNANESSIFGAVSASPCADAVDNDLDFYSGCADSQCAGQTGRTVPAALCQAAESTCNDDFDNDGDALPDCLDSQCNGLRGDTYTTAVCQFGNERNAGTCTDTFDNDADGRTDCNDNTFTTGTATNACWKQTGYGCPATEISCNDNEDNDGDMSYSTQWDNSQLVGVGSGSLTGRDCNDYDCAGNIACPNQENYTAGGVNDDAQCFDGRDNDLDGSFDCADSNCAAAINPNNTAQGCYASEFSQAEGASYQFCANGFDDDGSGLSDCSDASCKQQFGNCGPCPSREDYTWASCSDSSDNDSDATSDCADTSCAGKIGSAALGAICLAAEATNQSCSDGFDNDVDGLLDCSDPGCAGRTGPLGATCQPAAETSCGDGLDNDADGLADCADTQCAGIGSCAAITWTQVASCVSVPSYSGATAFTSDNPTVTATVQTATRVSSTDVIRFTGTATYSSLTIVVGDNTSSASYYPYAAASPTCTLRDTATGLTSTAFGFTAVVGSAIQIYNVGSGTFGAFDLTLTCPTPAVPAAIKYYPISLSALKSPSNYAEYGDVSFSTTLYENVRPTVTKIEGEGAIGATMSFPYSASGASRRFRAIPNDPNPYASGICKCDFTLSSGSPAYAGTGTSSSTCVSTASVFTQDIGTLNVSARAQDGAGNDSLAAFAAAYTINVTPANTTPLTLSPSQPFVNAEFPDVALSAEFTTGLTDNFSAATCNLYVYREDGSGNLAAIGGGFGPTLTAAVPAIPSANTVRCTGSFDYSTISPSLSDGRYFATLRVTDNDGNYVESNKRPFYVCGAVPGSGEAEPTNGCQYADFDRDGVPEGLYTTKYSATPYSCDNCVGLANASQADTDANGIGDMCEPTEQYGRCEIDTEIVCKYDSDEDPYCTGDPEDALCCPGPSVKDDPDTGEPKDPQYCRDPWGICESDGQVCFEHSDCPDGPGVCQDGETSCYVDTECTGATGVPVCSGADRCLNLLYPWIETKYGNVYSQKKIATADVPPASLYNATFCVTAKETIINFRSEALNNCAVATEAAARPTLPNTANQFTVVQGKLDLASLRSGKFGTVVNVAAGQLDAELSSYANRLGGRVFRVVGDATVSARTIYNDSARGQGTIFVDGGNLTITGDIVYEMNTVTNIRSLASLGWIVIDDGTGTKGNVYINGNVASVAGAFYSNGNGGFWSVTPPAPDSETQLTLYGLVVAKEFHLGRSYKSKTDGAERFIYDGRAVANPPPGFTDISKGLPFFTDTPAQ